MLTRILTATGLLLFSTTQVGAQDAKSMPEDGKMPSEILATIEHRTDFSRLVDMSWNDRGYYEIEYRTNDKAKVEINIDAKSGQPVDPD